MKKRILFVVSFSNFRDEEYFIPKDFLKSAGVSTKVTSNQTGKAKGVDGGEVLIDFEISQVKIDDFDVLVFIGGPGCLDDLDNKKSYNLIQNFFLKEKIICAICISPVILANAGILKGKRATVWSNSMNKKAINLIKEKGAIFKDDLVVVDGKIITANGPLAALEFAQKIKETLT